MTAEGQTYHFLAASQAFLESEPLQEVLEERQRYYQEQDKPIDFHYVLQPAFLELPELAPIRHRIDLPAAAVVSTDVDFIRWLQLRLTLVEMGSFIAPTEHLPDPLRSQAESP